MRVAILSDIHANLHALEAVAKDVQAADVQEIWCLGDVVGYGANPQECLAWVEENANLVVKGNHDHAVSTGEMAWFNPIAAQAARMHAQTLSPPERSRLYSWAPEILRKVGNMAVLLVHGSPDNPLEEYVHPEDARLGVARWLGRADLVLMGHTHHPYFAGPDGARPYRSWNPAGFAHLLAVPAAHEAPLLLNPGSVGQPRDGDPRASFALVDFTTKRAELHRVPYDVDAAATAIRKAGLDPTLALRLYRGR